MGRVAWDEQPPAIRSNRLYLDTVLALLEKGDGAAALSLARETRGLADVPSSLPYARLALSSCDMLIEISQIVAGEASPEIIASLEARRKKLPLMNQLLIAWGLEQAYAQTGQPEKAAGMRAWIDKTAPHCRGLAAPTTRAAGA